MARLFVSYARADQAPAAKIVHALERAGHDVWWDMKIEGGTRYSRLISEALDASDAVIVLWSKASSESDWVRDEAAHGRDRQRLVPLSMDSTKPPLGFRQYQSIDMSSWQGRVDAPQFRAVERAIATALSQELASPELSHGRWLNRRQLIGAGTAAAVAGGAALVGWGTGIIGPAGAEASSIAVLPFKNFSSDPKDAYLSDGLTDEIRSALGRDRRLMVLAATSSNAIREMAADAKEISRKLGVAFLLEGSVQRSGDVVSVGANLTNGRTGFSEWSQKIERPLGDIFAFENEIARMVSNAMSIRMEEEDSTTSGGTRNAQAYEAYLKGRALYNLAKDEATDREAKADFELAIAADPNFALAHAALSRSLSSLASNYAEADELPPLYATAIEQARRAIAIAPTLAEGHLALGYALFAGRLNAKGARPSYDAAYRYGRGDADIVLLYAVYTSRVRRFRDARDSIERALALDPLNPRTWRAAGSIDLASGRLAEAVTRYDRALSLNPKMSNANALKAYALIGLKRWADARSSLEKEPSDMFRLTGLAILGIKTADNTLARRSFDQLVSQVGDRALYQQAQVLAQWARPTEALDRLERARSVGDSGLTALATDPFMAPLANEPRYKSLRQALGFS